MTVSTSPPSFAGRMFVPEDLRPQANSFTALRWLLASSVMFSHGWDLTQPRAGLDPSVDWLSFPLSRLAVFLFFTLSGFLVTGSLVKRGVRDFVLARALRLLPGLWAMLVVLVLLLWLVFGSDDFTSYITDPMTLNFTWRNGLLYGGEFRLPGIFEGNRFANVANGSLWTIPQEVRCYILLAGFGAIGLLRSRWWFTLMFVALAAVHLWIPIDAVSFLVNPRRLAFSFFLGVMIYLWRERLWLSWPLALALVLAALEMPDIAAKTVAIQIAFGYLVFVIAFCLPARAKSSSDALPDYSYGIYIYAYPAQQAVAALGVGTTPWNNILIGFCLMLPFAALSWHFIEKPALSQKHRLHRRLIGASEARG